MSVRTSAFARSLQPEYTRHFGCVFTLLGARAAKIFAVNTASVVSFAALLACETYHFQEYSLLLRISQKILRGSFVVFRDLVRPVMLLQREQTRIRDDKTGNLGKVSDQE